MKNKKYIRNLSMIAVSLCITLTACGTENSGILTATVEQAVEASAESTAAAGQTAETDSETEGPLAQRDALEWEQRLDYTTERQAQRKCRARHSRCWMPWQREMQMQQWIVSWQKTGTR